MYARSSRRQISTFNNEYNPIRQKERPKTMQGKILCFCEFSKFILKKDKMKIFIYSETEIQFSVRYEISFDAYSTTKRRICYEGRR